MHCTDWRALIAQLPKRLRSLRPGARPQDIATVERVLDQRLLGRRLPRQFRNFLYAADGGWLGDHRIYGTPELLDLLRGVGAAPGTLWPRRRKLLPFHPVDRRGIECLDLGQPDAPVVWCRDRTLERRGQANRPMADYELHGLARRIGVWAGRRKPEMHPTYPDFLDWALDVLCDLRSAVPGVQVAGRN